MSVKTTAELVEDLFRTYRHPSGREYSNQEVSTALNDAVDASYIAKIRRGIIKNPGRHGLLALCRFFKVPSSYFFPELQSPYDPQQPSVEGAQTLPRSIMVQDARNKINELNKLLDALDIDNQENNRNLE
ncbi:MAG TPA: helix-turn-helix domain-containing protein [Roseiflexaceae bacterium]|nr:helix-turn-helix domain-containing protein [Roseiflexaceae bacterium]